MPKLRPACTFDVPRQPPMYAARAASTPDSIPCARRVPNSITGRPAAASTTRAAFDAIIVWKLIVASSAVSTICASAIGAVTRRSGSPGKQSVPSGIARTSPEKRKDAR